MGGGKKRRERKEGRRDTREHRERTTETVGRRSGTQRLVVNVAVSKV